MDVLTMSFHCLPFNVWYLGSVCMCKLVYDQAQWNHSRNNTDVINNINDKGISATPEPTAAANGFYEPGSSRWLEVAVH